MRCTFLYVNPVQIYFIIDFLNVDFIGNSKMFYYNEHFIVSNFVATKTGSIGEKIAQNDN